MGTVAFIHAVNPFGMAHFRRWNENNVDLNRNALSPEQFARLAKEDKLQETYLSFNSFFNPKYAPSWFDVNVGFWFKAAWNIARYGMLALKTALVGATYTQPQGIFYGGNELQASHVVLRDFVSKRFADMPASHVGWIDVHTGLGPCGVDCLLGNDQDRHELEEICPREEGVTDGFQGLPVKSPDEIVALRCERSPDVGRNEVSQSAGYEFTVGILSTEWVNSFFKPDTGNTLTLTQEFGTKPGLLVARAMMLENAGYHYDRAKHEYWRTFTRDAFYVRTDDWKRRVLSRGLDVIQKVSCRVNARVDMATSS